MKNIFAIKDEIKRLFNTGRDLSLMSYKCYVNIGSPKLSFENILLSSVGKEIVYTIGYFSYELCIDSFRVPTNFYLLKSLGYDMALEIDMINKLNSAVDEDLIQ